MNNKGNIWLIVLVLSLILGSVIIAATLFLQRNNKITNNTGTSSDLPPTSVENKIDNNPKIANCSAATATSIVHADLKQYYAEKGKYPLKILDLKELFSNIDEDLERWSKPPFYYNSDGKTYEFYEKLDDGTICPKDEALVNRAMDSLVRVGTNQLAQVVSLYYSEHKKLPESLDQVSYPWKHDPFTGEPYKYIIKSDGSGFIISGQISDGTEYKSDYPIR